jgi:hypothetical protein
MTSEARLKGWEKRREKYGPTGQPPYLCRRTGRTGPRPKLSDRVTDAEYIERLKALCITQPNGCWLYTGFVHKPPRNYGEMSYRGKNWRTHRLSYALHKGPIPKGMVVMHACDNPPCCNPAHLRLGTHLDNMSECRAKGRYYYANLTHCKNGHEFNDANTYYIKTPGPSFGLRACRACQRERQRRKYHENREFHNARNREYRRRRKSLSTEGSGSTVTTEP